MIRINAKINKTKLSITKQTSKFNKDMKFNESAVEEWAKEFAKAECRPVNAEDIRVVVAIALLHANDINNDKNLQAEIHSTDTWGGRVANRIKARGYSYELTTAAFYVIDTQIKNWSDVAMYVAYLQYVAVRDGYKTIDAKDLVERIFPGAKFPTDDERHRLWELQKIDKEDRERLGLIIDNTLDYSICYKSLFGTDSDGETE